MVVNQEKFVDLTKKEFVMVMTIILTTKMVMMMTTLIMKLLTMLTIILRMKPCDSSYYLTRGT